MQIKKEKKNNCREYGHIHLFTVFFCEYGMPPLSRAFCLKFLSNTKHEVEMMFWLITE